MHSPRQRRAALRSITAALLSAAVARHACASTWPLRPVTLVVPSPPGGGTDELARTVSAALAPHLQQSVVVENLAGAAGSLAAMKVARSAPDGHTLLVCNSDLVLAPLLLENPRYGLRDFTPIGLLGVTPLVLAAHPDVAAADFDHLVALARRSPGRLTIGVGSSASLTSLAAHRLFSAARIKLLQVPYKGAVPAVVALLAHEVDLVLTALVNVLAQVRQGRLKVLGVMSAQRLVQWPDLPTIGESAHARGVSFGMWAGIVGPAGLPADVVSTLHRGLQAVLSAPEYRAKRLASADVPATPGATPEGFSRFLLAEQAHLRRLVAEQKPG